MNVVVSVGDDGTWIKECGEGGKDTMSGMTDREKAVDWSENHQNHLEAERRRSDLETQTALATTKSPIRARASGSVGLGGFQSRGGSQ